ncbi:GNAT family N-acetyltransferase [Thalassomonas haliotis]|uniref:GNAT family N-acetyltransferase n=1 Tax=Thalassomonas haliotis TaxID=485448 RepID=A0ABY7VLB0_9GAMM|nr:GNAT family N-acetyltransferase [Thalassomonas haliotis]WDE13856.1 GNAT family N-acetyltransferase [Thalassomonas haliotis]
MHSFSTKRLIVRPLSPQDNPLYCQLYTDAKVMRNICPPLTFPQAEKAFKRTLAKQNIKNSHQVNWAIYARESNQPLGIQGLTWQPNIKTQADIGIMLLRRANGKLIPEEAMGALMEHAFDHYQLERITASFSKENLATKRFVKKLGFQFYEKEITNNNASIDCYIEQKSYANQFIITS